MLGSNALKNIKNYINKSNELLLLIAIVSFALFLRLYLLSDVPRSLYIDEVWSVYNPYLAENGLLALSLRGNAVYFFMGNYFTYSLFGASTFFTRLPAAIFGTGLVLIVYLLAKTMFSNKVGLISAILTAVSPWGIQFSRYSVPASNYVFFVTLFVYLMYKGVKTQAERKKLVYYSAASIMLGLTTYTHIASLAFIPVFLVGCLLLFTKKLNRKVVINGLKYLSMAILSASLTIYEYVNPVLLSHAGSRVSGSYSTFALSKNLWDLLSNVLERMYYHLSPDFLVTTGGIAFAAKTGFSETISRASLFRYTTGVVGTLNFYGIIIYPALIYLIYKVVKRYSLKEEQLLLWWIFAYVVVSAVSYYDNPNAARNIVGLPALLIAMAIFIHRGFNFVWAHLRKRLSRNRSKIITIFLSLTIVVSITAPTIYYLKNYFTDYPVQSARSFDYEYKIVADYLTAESLWNNTIYVRTDQSLWYSQQLLSFYSPNQPPSNIFAIDKIDSSWPLQDGASGSLFITQFQSDLEKLEELGISYEQIRAFQLPSGETALYLVKLPFPDDLSPVINGFTKEEYSIATFHNWNIGRSPEGLNLELKQNANSSLVVDYDYNGNATDWWYVYKVFENKISLANYPLFKATWNVQKEGEGSTFIQFLVESADGQRTWIPNNRFIYPAKRYLLANILKNYTSIVGVMLGDELQKGETGKIVLSELNFFRVPEVDISDSQNSKWNWIDVENRGLLINRDANVTIPLFMPDGSPQSKYISLSVLPLQEGYAYATITFGNNSRLDTKITYLPNGLEITQPFLIVLKEPQKLKQIAIQTKASAILYSLRVEILINRPVN